MEYVIGVIVALLAGLFYYKRKSDKAAVDARLGELRGKDAQLEVTENDLREAIAEIDSNIEKIRKEREKLKENKTLEERAEDANKRYE